MVINLRNALGEDNSFFLVFFSLNKERSKGRPNSKNYKRFLQGCVSGGCYILSGEGRDGGGVSGEGNTTDKSREASASMV